MDSLTISKKKLFNLIIYSLFYWTSLVYYETVNEYVNYMWNLENRFSIFFSFFNYLLFMILIYILKKRHFVVSQFFEVIVIGIFLPISIISTFTNNGIYVCIIIFIIIISLIYFQKFFEKIKLGLKSIKYFDNYRLRNYFLFTITICLVYIVIGFGQSISFSLIDTLVNVYQIRADNTISGLFSYFIGWIPTIFFPIGIDFSLNENKIYPLILILLVSYVIFQIFAMKTHLFIPILLLFFGIIFTKFSKIKDYAVVSFFGLIFFISILFEKILAPFIDRFFYLPGMLNIRYFDFFSENNYNYFNGSKIGLLFGIENYNQPLGFIIDSAYGGDGMNANTGVFASIFAELGYFGLLISVFVLIFILNTLIILHKKYNLWVI